VSFMVMLLPPFKLCFLSHPQETRRVLRQLGVVVAACPTLFSVSLSARSINGD